jgi:DNA-binding XRE family transcriptional regulator
LALYVTIKRSNLRYWRQKAGLTQKELAHLAGLREATISNIETENVDVCITTAMKLAIICNCAIEDLFEFDIRRR